MIPLVLVMLLMGAQGQLSDLVSSISNGLKKEPLGVISAIDGVTKNHSMVVDTVANGLNKGTFGVVDLTSSAKEENLGLIETLGSVVQKEVGAVAQPVESAVLLTATSQCETVKKLLGVDYYSMAALKEVDLNQLTLDFVTSKLKVIYNITDAAELLPVSRNFDPNLPLIIFIHGFISSPESDSFGAMLDAFHKKGQYNVLALDSSAYIAWFYLRATTYVRFIGEKLGRMLANMVQHGLNPKAIHLIGHSLGAHISGFTGKEFNRLTGMRVGRISGLDAAGPCFYNADSEVKLNATDAEFVDVIHTTHGSLGITEPAGHVDFYPNGGTQQPDCVLQSCSHGRAWALYSESILNPRAFPAVQCTGWSQFRQNKCDGKKVLMGYNTTPDTRGLFFLRTRSKSPFDLGDEGATYKNTEGVLKSLQPLGPGAFFG